MNGCGGARMTVPTPHRGASAMQADSRCGRHGGVPRGLPLKNVLRSGFAVTGCSAPPPSPERESPLADTSPVATGKYVVLRRHGNTAPRAPLPTREGGFTAAIPEAHAVRAPSHAAPGAGNEEALR